MSCAKQGSRSPQALTRLCRVNIVPTYGSTRSAARCSHYRNPVSCDPRIKSNAVDAKTFYSASDIDLISPEVRRLLNQFLRFKEGD